MSSKWSLQQLLASLHEDIEQRLGTARVTIGHPGEKGDASEAVWIQMLNTYLPARYKALRAHVVDSHANFSDQIDVVICDRQYTPFIFSFQDMKVVPAESVYAVFEAKQTVNAKQIAYAQAKAESVRSLHRTSLPIPHAGGVYDPKPLPPILAGILAFESDWDPPLGTRLVKSLTTDNPLRTLEMGCVAAHGIFNLEPSGGYELVDETKPATAFLLELIARLQTQATVPMIDVRAYAEWLSPDKDSKIVTPEEEG